jgi:hypothetical protein
MHPPRAPQPAAPLQHHPLELLRQVRDRIAHFKSVPGWSQAQEAWLTSSRDLAELQTRRAALERGDALIRRQIEAA